MKDLDFSEYNLDWGIGFKSEENAEFDNTEYSYDDFDDETFKYECHNCGFRFN